MSDTSGHTPRQKPSLYFREFSPQVSGCFHDCDFRIWVRRGKIHRDGAPAVIRPDGSELWFIMDELHRLDGPAITEADGTEVWYYRNKLHRVGAPAIIYSDGREEYWENGKELGGPINRFLHELKKKLHVKICAAVN